MELTTAKLRKLTKPGLYGDGQNLYLQVRGPQQRSWLFRYMIRGRARSMGLGHVDDVSLVEARNKADAARRLVREGIDPLDARAAEQARSKAITFSAAAKRFVDAHEAGWRCEKHRATWRSSLAADVEPVIGALPVEAIDTAAVMRVLTPIWQTKPETASRIRGRIEKVLSFATMQGWRSGPNPAVWRGHLQLLLPAVRKVRPMQHFAALDWREAPAFMTTLREQNGMGARALEFAILTAARSGEVRGATWDEIDLDHAIWTIPGSRMKAGKEHRVPLSAAAIALLQSVALLRAGGGLIFPSHQKRHQPMIDRALSYPLERMGRRDLTVHGFRSTFRDWAAEATGHPNHVVEQALAHTIGSAVEAAYRRGDLFAKRVVLMNDWASYLEQPLAKVVHLPRSAAHGHSGEPTAPRRPGGTTEPAEAPGAA
jgi:integrase